MLEPMVYIHWGQREGRLQYLAKGVPMVYGPHELVEDVLRNNMCVKCGACVSLCPYFRSYAGMITMVYPCECTQGRCFSYCPRAEVDLDALSRTFFGAEYPLDPLGMYVSMNRSRAGRTVPTTSFQSGGSVSALVMTGLERGMCDAAVLTTREDLIPVPCIVEDPADVLKCSGSKFTAAPTIEGVNEAIEKGYEKICVVATPCQSLAVAKMKAFFVREGLMDPINMVIGLFCMWAFDLVPFHEALSSHISLSSLKKMKIPPPPAEVLELITESGTVEIPLESLRPFVLDSCHFCFDLTAEFSDVSVGLFEGDPGWNSLIIRTEKGTEWVDTAVKSNLLETEPFPDARLDHLRSAASSKKIRGFSRLQGRGLVNGPGRIAMRLNGETLHRILEEE